MIHYLSDQPLTIHHGLTPSTLLTKLGALLLLLVSSTGVSLAQEGKPSSTQVDSPPKTLSPLPDQDGIREERATPPPTSQVSPSVDVSSSSPSKTGPLDQGHSVRVSAQSPKEELFKKDCPPSSLKVELVGIYIGKGRRSSYARIRMNRALHTYRIGHLVGDRKIMGIQWTPQPRVILLTEHGHECLTLKTKGSEYIKADTSLKRPSRPKPTRSTQSSQAASESMLTKEVFPRRFEVDRTQLPEKTSIDDLFSQLRLVPYFQDGQQSGYRLLSIRRTSPIYQLGMRSGDIVLSVNGVTLNSIQHISEIYDQIMQKLDQTVTLRFLRRGKERSYEWVIK